MNFKFLKYLIILPLTLFLIGNLVSFKGQAQESEEQEIDSQMQESLNLLRDRPLRQKVFNRSDGRILKGILEGLKNPLTIDPLTLDSTQRIKSNIKLLNRDYTQAVSKESQKPYPDLESLKTAYLKSAAEIFNFNEDTTRFFMTLNQTTDPFLYRDPKTGDNYIPLTPKENQHFGQGTLIKLETFINSRTRHVTFRQTIKSSANPRSMNFFPREYLRFMAVSYSVVWTFCRTKWDFSQLASLKFFSLYKTHSSLESGDPLCDKHFIKSLENPIGWLGFYAFVMANHNLAPKVTNKLLGGLAKTLGRIQLPLGTKLAHFAMFSTNLLAGGLGMSFGLLASDMTHRLLESPNLKACFASIESAGWMGEACQEAYKDFLLINQDIRDGIIISTESLLSSFIASTVTNMAVLHPTLRVALSPLNMASNLSYKGAVAAYKSGSGISSRLGFQVLKSLGWALRFTPQGWRVGALVYGGQTFSFLAFDQFFSPYIEENHYELTKGIKLKHSVRNLYDIVGHHKFKDWTELLNEYHDEECDSLGKFQNDYKSIAENTGLSSNFFRSVLECESSLILDTSLEKFSRSMSEYRDYYILSKVKKTMAHWEEKWNSFYFNYVGSMRMLDLLSKYRRDYVSRLGDEISLNDKYGYNKETYQSMDFFIGEYSPFYKNPSEESLPFLSEDYEVDDYTEAVNFHGYGYYVESVKSLITEFISLAEKYKIMVGGSYYSTYPYVQPFLKQILGMNDPILIAEEIMKLKDLDLFDFQTYEELKDRPSASPSKRLYDIYMELFVISQPLFPYYHRYFGQSYEADISSSDRSQDIDIMTAYKAYAPPYLFNPNCTVFSPFKSRNPICWGNTGLKDPSGVSYSNRFKIEALSDWILAHMTCGVSNDPYWSKSNGPRNISFDFLDSIFGFKMELNLEDYLENGFEAQFLPPNLIRGAPACRSGKYRLNGEFVEQPESPLLNQMNGYNDLSAPNINQTHIKVNGKIYYGALNAILDPSNEWIISPELESVKNYWDIYVFPRSKKVAVELYRHYQYIIDRDFLSLFHPQNIESGDFLGTFRSFTGTPPPPLLKRIIKTLPLQYRDTHPLELEDFLSTSLRDSFLKEAQMYLMILREINPLYSLDNILQDLNHIEEFIKKISIYEEPDSALLEHLSSVFNISHDFYFLNSRKYKYFKIEEDFKKLRLYFKDRFSTLPEGLSWKFESDRIGFLSEINSAKKVSIFRYYIIGGLFQMMKEMKANTSVDFGPEDIYLDENLLFTSEVIVSYKEKFKDLYKNYLANFYLTKETAQEVIEELLLMKITQITEVMLKEAQIDESIIVKEWVSQRLEKHFVSLLSEIKQKYDNWIVGARFYLNSFIHDP